MCFVQHQWVTAQHVHIFGSQAASPRRFSGIWFPCGVASKKIGLHCMSETLQSDICCMARGQNSRTVLERVLFSSASSGDEIQSLLHADMEAWRKSSNEWSSVPRYSTGRLISESNILWDFSLNLYSKSSAIKKDHYRVLSQGAENSDAANCLTFSSFLPCQANCHHLILKSSK